MEYLTQKNKRVSGKGLIKDEINAKDKTLVVIGGGDTGSDCVGTAIRQGAKKIYQLEIMPKPPVDRDESMPWPTFPRTLKTTTSHEEGCIRQWCVGTKKIVGEGGNLKELHCINLQWDKTEAGGLEMKEIEGSEFVIEADLIILAMGFIHPQHEGLIKNLGLKLDSRGNVATDETYMTNINKVFVAGDARTGQSLVVKVLKEGCTVARNVDLFLMGESFLKG